MRKLHLPKPMACTNKTTPIGRLMWPGALAGAVAALLLLAAPMAATEKPVDSPRASDGAAASAGPASAQAVTPRLWMPLVYKLPAPAVFAKGTPADGATGLSAGLGVVLTWTQSHLATAYEICFSQGTVTPCTAGTGFTHTTTQTSWHTGPLTPGALYFWHVRAVNSSGVTYSDGNPAAARQFQTRAAPTAFSKSAPLNGSTNHPALNGVTLSWSASTNVDGYRVCLTTSPTGCDIWDNYNLVAGTNTSYATGQLLPNTTYYWQVRADNSSWFAFANGAATARHSFTTQPAPGAFNKSLPASGDAPNSVRLEWTAAQGASSYDICLSTSAVTCGSDAGYTINTAGTDYTPSGLSPGTTYFWNVRARNGSGFSYANGSISQIWNFLAPAGAGGTTPCDAVVAAPNTNYTRPQNQTDIYYALVVNQPSRVNLSLSGATGQLQFRTPNQYTCPSHNTTLIDYEPVSGAGAASIEYHNVTPGTYYVRIVTTTPGVNNLTFNWSVTPGHTYYEPNNTACAATTVALNTDYLAYPENSRPDVGVENDFYQFTLNAQTTVNIQFSSYNAGQRQVQLRGGASCNNTSLVDGSAFVANASSGNIQRTLAAGTYWVRFVTIDGAQSRTRYTFRVSTGSMALMSQCDASNPAACDGQPNPNHTQRIPPIPLPGETPTPQPTPPLIITPIP